LHPARSENTGTVILEAMVAGLPSMVSSACGYANFVRDSNGGECIDQPEDTSAFTQQLIKMLDKPRLQQLSQNALDYAATHDLYSMPQHAAALVEMLAKKISK
ncbi:glycosyltransferase, partial [Methylophaga sp. UBA4204]